MRKWLWVALTSGNENFFVFQASTGPLEHSGASRSCSCLLGPSARSLPAAGIGIKARFLTVPFIYLPHVMLGLLSPGRPCREGAGDAGGAAGSSRRQQRRGGARGQRRHPSLSIHRSPSCPCSPPPGRLLSAFSLPFSPRPFPAAQPGQLKGKRKKRKGKIKEMERHNGFYSW